MTQDNKTTAYDAALKAIRAGQATASALWLLLSSEEDRAGYALKPMPWEGAGEYQHVSFADGRDGLVRIYGWKSLPTHLRQNMTGGGNA